MKRFVDIYNVWINEFKAVFRDEATILILIIVPLFYPLLYAYLYNEETASEVPMVVVDDSKSSLSREFIRNVDGAHDVKIVGHAVNMEEAQEILKRNGAFGILYFPYDFSKSIHTQQQTQVKFYSDMSSLLYYKAMFLTINEVALKIGADIRVEEMGYKSRQEDQASMQAIRSEWVSYYNVASGFSSFFIPAILIVIIQQTMLLGVATLTGTRNDRRRGKGLSTPLLERKMSVLTVTFGKGLCYASIYALVNVWILRVVPYLFNLPRIGDPWTIAVFMMPFLLSCTFFCLMLSYFCSQREFSMLLFASSSVMIIFLSGISWPWDAIPAPLKAVAYMLPSTPGIHGFIRINTMGAALTEVWTEYIILWVQALVYWGGAALMYTWWTRKTALPLHQDIAL
jgi:ABC-2 type transport system permease protein